MPAFVHRQRVRYHEIDTHKHVYNARYLEYVDVAFLEFLRDLGWTFEAGLEIGFDPVLGRVEIDFRRGAVHDEELAISVAPSRLGRTSFDIEFAISNAADGAAIADAVLTYVNVDTESERPAPIPDPVRAALLTTQPLTNVPARK